MAVLSNRSLKLLEYEQCSLGRTTEALEHLSGSKCQSWSWLVALHCDRGHLQFLVLRTRVGDTGLKMSASCKCCRSRSLSLTKQHGFPPPPALAPQTLFVPVSCCGTRKASSSDRPSSRHLANARIAPIRWATEQSAWSVSDSSPPPATRRTAREARTGPAAPRPPPRAQVTGGTNHKGYP